MMKYLLLVSLILSSVLLWAESGLNFEAENIDFSLRKSVDHPDSLVWEVCGTYSFSNTSEQLVKQIIAFPIPCREGLSPQQDLKLEKLEGDRDTVCELISSSDQGFSFGLDLPPESYLSIKIYYRQSVGGKQASYILTTANTWAQPLPSAIYSLYVEKGIRLDSVSLPRPLTLSSKTGDYYFLEYRNFRPKQDFVLSLD